MIFIRSLSCLSTYVARAYNSSYVVYIIAMANEPAIYLGTPNARTSHFIPVELKHANLIIASQIVRIKNPFYMHVLNNNSQFQLWGDEGRRAIASCSLLSWMPNLSQSVSNRWSISPCRSHTVNKNYTLVTV